MYIYIVLRIQSKGIHVYIKLVLASISGIPPPAITPVNLSRGSKVMEAIGREKAWKLRLVSACYVCAH